MVVNGPPASFYLNCSLIIQKLEKMATLRGKNGN